jgi:hypothetical protein
MELNSQREQCFMDLSLLRIGRGGISVSCFRNWESDSSVSKGRLRKKASDEIFGVRKFVKSL